MDNIVSFPDGHPKQPSWESPGQLGVLLHRISSPPAPDRDARQNGSSAQLSPFS
jgi:hypothetical protein